MKTTAKVIAIALGGLCVATPAAFADNEFGFEFAFDRNELATETGANSVYADLLAEVEAECEHSAISDTLGAKKLQRICVEETMAETLAEMENEALTAIHSANG